MQNKELWIYDEHYELAMTTQNIFDMVKKKEMLNASITGDSAESRLIAELKSKGLKRLHKSIKGKGSVNQGILFLQGFKIYIHPSCEKTIEEFNTYTFTKNKQGKWLNEPIDDNNHIIDTLRYSMERYHMGKRKDSKDKYTALQSLGL